MLYTFFIHDYLDAIPILNWGWLGYNIALGPLGDQGIYGILPFVPVLIYMLSLLNYYEEMYFRKSKKLVVLWSFLHITMGVQHVILVLLPIGFIYKYIHDKHGLKNSYSAHFSTNIFLVFSMVISYILSI